MTPDVSEVVPPADVMRERTSVRVSPCLPYQLTLRALFKV